MEIVSIKIDGYANLNEVELNLQKFNALVALNNYGKSNILKAIDFGFDFIKADERLKSLLMMYEPGIPINKKLAEKNFQFEIEFRSKLKHQSILASYQYSFTWEKDDKKKGQKIVNEVLRYKDEKTDVKYRTLIKRDEGEAYYLPSFTGRCDKTTSIEKNQLLVNKLKNFDDLFYLEIINDLNDIQGSFIQTTDPTRLFSSIATSKNINKRDELSMPDGDGKNISHFIYHLVNLKPDFYEIFKDSVKSLLPNIEDFKPIEIDLKKESAVTEKKEKIPFNLPEKLYDIRIKEFSNNQQTSISAISSGSQRIIYILAMTIAAEINNIPLLCIEELENSIHPHLMQRLLIILSNLNQKSKLIIASHSPYLITYLDFDDINIGIPNKNGVAFFKKIKKTKQARLIKIAQEERISIGDLIFDKLIDCSVDHTNKFFDEFVNN